MLYITSVAPIYLIARSLCLWLPSSNSLSPHPTPLITTNLISFVSLFVCFWSIIDLQHHVSVMQPNNLISIYFKMITTVSLVTMSSHKDITKLLTVFPCCVFHNHDSFILNLCNLNSMVSSPASSGHVTHSGQSKHCLPPETFTGSGGDTVSSSNQWDAILRLWLKLL